MKQHELINRIATDKDLRAQLRKDAKAALEGLGMDTGDIQIKVVEDSASLQHFALPTNPNKHIGDQDLDSISSAGDGLLTLGLVGLALLHGWKTNKDTTWLK